MIDPLLLLQSFLQQSCDPPPCAGGVPGGAAPDSDSCDPECVIVVLLLCNSGVDFV